MSTEIKKHEQNSVVPIEGAHVLLDDPAFKLPENRVFNVVLLEVTKCYIHLNWAKPKENDLNLMVTELTKNIQNHAAYRSLRLKEIPTAFAEGIRKEYGEFMGLSIVSFEMFLRGYLKSQYRIELGKSLPTLQIEQSKKPSSEEIFVISSDNANKAFQDFKSGKDISLVAPAVYRFLYRLKLINYSEEELTEFINEATTIVRNELIAKKGLSIDKNFRDNIDKVLSDNQSMERKIIIEAQRQGCYAYLRTLQFEDENLSELISRNRKEFTAKKP